MRPSLGATPGAVPWSEWPARGPGWRLAPAVGWCPAVVGRGCRRQEAGGGAGPAGVPGRPSSYRSRSLLPPVCRPRRAGAGWHDAVDTNKGQVRTRDSCCDAIDSRRIMRYRQNCTAVVRATIRADKLKKKNEKKNADTDSWWRHLTDTKLAAIWPWARPLPPTADSHSMSCNIEGFIDPHRRTSEPLTYLPNQ